MRTSTKLTARDDIRREYKATHTTDVFQDNWVPTVNHLFTRSTTRLNKQLGL